jgi:GTPase SAR1 family protein
LDLNIWDIGGQDRLRPLWRHYYNNVDAIIFVVDSADTDRYDDPSHTNTSHLLSLTHLPSSFFFFLTFLFLSFRISESADELQKMLQEEQLQNAKLLIYANKQDLSHAVPVSQLSQKLGLTQNGGRREWYIQSTCAVSGDGLYEGLDWLSEKVRT